MIFISKHQAVGVGGELIVISKCLAVWKEKVDSYQQMPGSLGGKVDSYQQMPGSLGGTG